MLTADVEVSGLDRDFWHWWPSADGKLLALCPLAATDTFQLQVGVAPDTAGEPPLAQIQVLVEERSGRTDIRIRRVDWQSIWRFNVRMVDRYRAGRVFLAGDSAHVHSPAGGLGMNTGIQDAYNLGWKIANVLRGAPAGLLDTYEQERLPLDVRARRRVVVHHRNLNHSGTGISIIDRVGQTLPHRQARGEDVPQPKRSSQDQVRRPLTSVSALLWIWYCPLWRHPPQVCPHRTVAPPTNDSMTFCSPIPIAVLRRFCEDVCGCVT
jgi:2-polyprenyl-6-methoxyphenol hydroxylase-like FAD-dependent oxidoreductase